jgi:hypothetical protein
MREGKQVIYLDDVLTPDELAEAVDEQREQAACRR